MLDEARAPTEGAGVHAFRGGAFFGGLLCVGRLFWLAQASGGIGAAG